MIIFIWLFIKCFHCCITRSKGWYVLQELKMVSWSSVLQYVCCRWSVSVLWTVIWSACTLLFVFEPARQECVGPATCLTYIQRCRVILGSGRHRIIDAAGRNSGVAVLTSSCSCFGMSAVPHKCSCELYSLSHLSWLSQCFLGSDTFSILPKTCEKKKKKKKKKWCQLAKKFLDTQATIKNVHMYLYYIELHDSG